MSQLKLNYILTIFICLTSSLCISCTNNSGIQTTRAKGVIKFNVSNSEIDLVQLNAMSNNFDLVFNFEIYDNTFQPIDLLLPKGENWEITTVGYYQSIIVAESKSPLLLKQGDDFSDLSIELWKLESSNEFQQSPIIEILNIANNNPQNSNEYTVQIDVLTYQSDFPIEIEISLLSGNCDITEPTLIIEENGISEFSIAVNQTSECTIQGVINDLNGNVSYFSFEDIFIYEDTE